MEMKLKSRIMDKDQMERTTHRMAHEILEQNRGSANICLVGIRSRGVPLARGTWCVSQSQSTAYP